MSGIIVSIEIDATPARVWEVVEPVERHVDWMHDAVAIRFTGEQTRGIGTEFLCDTKVGPFKLVDRMEITEWVPGEVMGVRHTGLVTGSGRFTIDAHRPRPAHTVHLAGSAHLPVVAGRPRRRMVGGKIALGPIWRRNLQEPAAPRRAGDGRPRPADSGQPHAPALAVAAAATMITAKRCLAPRQDHCHTDSGHAWRDRCPACAAPR